MPRLVTTFAFYSCVLLSQACASAPAATPATPASQAVMIEFTEAVNGAEPALLAAMAARAGAGVSVHYRAAVSAQRHAYRLDCPAGDSGCRDAISRLLADPIIRSITADQVRSRMQGTQ